MGKLVINSYDEFAAHLGEELGTSEWLEVDQERINLFADATLDHQWIHVNVERAREESPYKSTIAHGYLTLSLLPYMWEQIIEVNNIKMMVNYGMNDMRFGQPVITVWSPSSIPFRTCVASARPKSNSKSKSRGNANLPSKVLRPSSTILSKQKRGAPQTEAPLILYNKVSLMLYLLLHSHGWCDPSRGMP